jgi:hypothetical protein
MNIETGEVRELKDLTDADRKARTSDGASLLWLRIPKGYTPKIPTAADDIAHVKAAQAKRDRKNAKRRRP